MKTSIKQDLFQLFTGGIREKGREGEREREIVSAKADSCLAGSQTQLNVHPVLSGTQCNYSTLQTSNYHHAHTEMPDSQEQSLSSLWPKWSSNISLYALFDVFRLNMDDFVTLWSILHKSLQDETENRFRRWPLDGDLVPWIGSGKSEWSTLWKAQEKNVCRIRGRCCVQALPERKVLMI